MVVDVPEYEGCRPSITGTSVWIGGTRERSLKQRSWVQRIGFRFGLECKGYVRRSGYVGTRLGLVEDSPNCDSVCSRIWALVTISTCLDVYNNQINNEVNSWKQDYQNDQLVPHQKFQGIVLCPPIPPSISSPPVSASNTSFSLQQLIGRLSPTDTTSALTSQTGETDPELFLEVTFIVVTGTAKFTLRQGFDCDIWTWSLTKRNRLVSLTAIIIKYRDKGLGV